MTSALTLFAGFPTRSFSAGEELLVEGQVSGTLLVLIEGAVEVRKGDVVITAVDEPGAFLGEISVLLGTPHSASVVAREHTRMFVVEDAAAAIIAKPEIALAIGRLLARRLEALTGYLADIKRQYAGTGGHLELMDKVLGELISMRPRSIDLGSERSDVPDY